MGDFVRPFLALFLTTKLGLPIETAGLYAAAVGVSLIIGNLSGGFLGDYFKHKRSVVLTQTIGGLIIFSCGFLDKNLLIPNLLVVSQFFLAAARPSYQSMIIDIAKGEQRKHAFALLYLGINLGVAIGPIIAGFLFEHYVSWIFWGDGLTTLIAVILIQFLIPESHPDLETLKNSTQDKTNGERAESAPLLVAFFRRPFLCAFVVLALFASFIYAQNTFTLPLHLNKIFDSINPLISEGIIKPRGAKYFGYLMCINAVVVLIFTTILTHLLRKQKPIVNVAFAVLLYGIGFGMLSFAGIIPEKLVFPYFILSTLIWTWGEIIHHTFGHVYRANHIPINQRGRFNGLIQSLLEAGKSGSHVFSGFFIGAFSIERTWILIFIITLILSSAFLILYQIEEGVKKKAMVS